MEGREGENLNKLSSFHTNNPFFVLIMQLICILASLFPFSPPHAASLSLCLLSLIFIIYPPKRLSLWVD